MAEYSKEKKYWLKLKRDFFKRHDMMILEAMPNGKEYELFYLKLMVESIDHNGELRFSETIPYNESMLSTITNTNIDIVRSACKILHELGMVEVLSDGTLYLQEVNKLLGCTTEGAEKKALQRERTKGGQLSTILEIEKDIDIYKKESIEKENTHNFEDFLNNIPTLQEIQEFITLKNFKNVDAERFKDYYDSVGWKKGNTPITNWQALVGMWEREQIKQNGLKKVSQNFEEHQYTKEEHESVYVNLNENLDDLF